MPNKHDFKAALEEVGNGLEISKEIGDNENVEFLTTIKTALRITDRLQSGEVSEGVEGVAWNTLDEGVFRAGLKPVKLFKAMAARLIKEESDE